MPTNRWSPFEKVPAPFSEPNMLCQACKEITLAGLKAIPSGYRHSANFEALQASSRSCSLCAVFWHATTESNIFKTRSKKANSEDNAYVQIKDTGDAGELLSMLWIVAPQSSAEDDIDWGDISLEGYGEEAAVVALYSIPDSRAISIITSQKVEVSADSDAAYMKVHRWLWECSVEHSACPVLPPASLKYKDRTEIESLLPMLQHMDPVESVSLNSAPEAGHETPGYCSVNGAEHLLPSRVLDVGPSDGSQEPYLHVCETPTYGLWVALSHCWGTVPPLKTTINTLSAHKRGIAMAQLPPSFRDVVLITRNLGIRHLWIDSLCIVQDDLEDWKVESAQMSRIYGMSFLTVIAAGSSNSHGGCFIPRSIPVAPAELYPSDSPGPFYVAQYVPESREPTEKRGWCYQEALLPKRTLSYGTKMMTWRCQSGSFTEQGGYKSQPETLHHDLDREIYGYSKWETVVQEYTRRSLTQQKDKLVALAGVVEELYRVWHDTYLAGLWKGDIMRQLLWRTDVNKDPTQGIEPTRISDPQHYYPSWSWGSLSWPVLFYAHWLKDYDDIATLVEAKIIPLGESPFGGVSCARLTIEGPMERLEGEWEFNGNHKSHAIVRCGPYLQLTATCFLDVPAERHWQQTELDFWTLFLSNSLGSPSILKAAKNIFHYVT